MQPFSSVGMARLAIYSVLLLCNLIVFAVSAHVNSFHGFFYVADQAPFVLSIFTGLIVGAVVVSDILARDSPLSRPVPEVTWLAALSLVWLCFNAFSTSRWRFVQATDCASLPASTDFAKATGWCQSVQALRGFVWLEWVILVCALLFIGRFVASGRRGSLARRTGPTFTATFVSKPMDAFADRHRSSFLQSEPRAGASDYHFGGFDSKSQPQSQPQSQPHAEQSQFGAYGRQQPQFGGYDDQQAYGVYNTEPQYAGYGPYGSQQPQNAGYSAQQPQHAYAGYNAQQQYASHQQHHDQQQQQYFDGGAGYAQ